jgi:hypothetical protein
VVAPVLTSLPTPEPTTEPNITPKPTPAPVVCSVSILRMFSAYCCILTHVSP